MVSTSVLLFILFFLHLSKIGLTTATETRPKYCQRDHLDSFDNEIEPLEEIVYTCSGGGSIKYFLEELDSKTTKLIIANTTLNGDAPVDSKCSIKSLQIQNSFIGPSVINWVNRLTELDNLAIISCWTHEVIDHNDHTVRAFELKMEPLKKLQILEVAKCNITNLDSTGVNNSDVFPRLILSDNSFECGQDFLWLYNLHRKNINKRRNKIILNNTVCFMEKMNDNMTFQALYTLRDKPFLSVMEYKREVAVNCPSRCKCEFIGMHTKDRPLLSVDCIGLNMTQLPNVIPKGSSRFNLTRNLISNLSPLYSNVLYRKVSFMDLSHNRIAYLDPDKFAQVLRQQPNGVGFNLDHNLLAKFPAEVMLKVFQELKYMPQFFLGFNPYICSCDYIGHFQELIYYYMYDIKDHRDIRCSDEDPYNPQKLVLAVDTRELCASEPLFQVLDVINFILALILLFLILDFIYNYRQYRKYRKLPWIVTKFKC